MHFDGYSPEWRVLSKLSVQPWFQDEIGTLKSAKAKLMLKEGSQPKFHKARPVLYVPHETEGRCRAETPGKRGILYKVKLRDWATLELLQCRQNT